MSCGCPLTGSVRGQVGRDFEQPGLAEVVPAHGGGDWTRWSSMVSSNPNHSVILCCITSIQYLTPLLLFQPGSRFPLVLLDI